MPANFTSDEREIIYEKLIQNGYELLSKYGLKKLKVSDIAKSADIATGTFYNFFASKYEFVIKVIEARRNISVENFIQLSKKYPEGIPYDAAKRFFIENLEYNNVYRLLSQDDYESLIAKLPKNENDENNAKEFAKFMMSKLKTDKGIEEFFLFSESYKIIIMGSSDIEKLNKKLLDKALDRLIGAACEILY